MTLEELYIKQGSKSDKGTVHDYILGYYSKEFLDKRDEKIKLIVSSCFSAPHESTFRKVRLVRNPDDYDYHMIHIKAGKIY
jgi:hypothetical protein